MAGQRERDSGPPNFGQGDRVRQVDAQRGDAKVPRGLTVEEGVPDDPAVALRNELSVELGVVPCVAPVLPELLERRHLEAGEARRTGLVLHQKSIEVCGHIEVFRRPWTDLDARLDRF